MQQQILRSLIERDGGSDYRMNKKTYHFRPNSAGDHVCPLDDKADFQGFLAITEGFELYDGEEVPAEAGVTPDRGQAAPAPAPDPEPEPEPAQAEEASEPEPAPEPGQGGLDPTVKEQLLQMEVEPLIQWAADNAPEAQVNRKMKPATIVAQIEEAMNGNG